MHKELQRERERESQFLKETYTKGKGQCTFDRFKAAVEPATATARLRERERAEKPRR